MVQQQVVRYVQQPRGLILNDNDAGVDHLQQSIYADALAQSINKVETPITIGLFAKWGSGKTFLMKHILSILRKTQNQNEHDSKNALGENRKRGKPSSMTCGIFWMIFILICLAVSLAFTIKPSIIPYVVRTSLTTTLAPVGGNTSSNDTLTTSAGTTISPIEKQNHLVRFISIGIATALVLIVMLITCCGKLNSSYIGSISILLYALFTKIPTKKKQSLDVVGDPGENADIVLERAPTGESVADNIETISNELKPSSTYARKYIFAPFQAWEFAGSDSLWAGIVTNISDALEAEFGVMTARLFRTISVEEMSTDLLHKSGENDRIIYFELWCQEIDQATEIAKQYGVIKNVSILEDLGRNPCWFKVEYFKAVEARSAFDGLSITEVKVRKTPPQAAETQQPVQKSFPSTHASNASTTSKTNDIEMNPLIHGNRNRARHHKDSDRGKEVTAQTDSNKRVLTSSNGFWGHFRKHPKNICCVPYLIWVVLCAICVITLPIVLYLTVEFFNLKLYSDNMAAELGFMSQVKDEVEIMTKLIECANFVLKKDHKVVITIDDLDRIQLNKVKSVFEAISILLSDRASPFVCIVAVDSRVAVKCIEEGMGEALVSANVTGHEYLKKIINLPVCMPQVENSSKKRFIAGLIDQSDSTVKKRRDQQKEEEQNRDNRGTQRRQPLPSNQLDGVYPNHLKSRVLPYDTVSTDEADNDGFELPDQHYYCSTGSSWSLNSPDDNRPIIYMDEDDKGGYAQISRNSPQPHEIPQLIDNGCDGQDRLLRDTRPNRTPPLITRKISLPRQDGDEQEYVDTDKDHELDSEQDSVDTDVGLIDRGDKERKTHSNNGRDSSDTNVGQIKKPMPKTLSNGKDSVDTDIGLIDKEDEKPKSPSIGGATSVQNGKTRRPGGQTVVDDVPSASERSFIGDGFTSDRLLFECRSVMLEDETLHSYLEGSPRNIKRIFNVISLTCRVIGSHQRQKKIQQTLRMRTQRQDSVHTSGLEKESEEAAQRRLRQDAKELVWWTVLTDQWPFRTSYILQVIEDADQREWEHISDNTSLVKVYNDHVLRELKGSDESLLTLDGDPDILINLLNSLSHETGLNNARARFFSEWTVNLDRSLRQSIAIYRDSLQREKHAKESESAQAIRYIRSDNDVLRSVQPTVIKSESSAGTEIIEVAELSSPPVF